MKLYEDLSDDLREWALKQPLFFTASAPTHGLHINCSPKGAPLDTLSVFDSRHAAYLDLTGSGAETISHIYDNGRVTLMWASTEVVPRIMRWFCKGRVIEYDHPEYKSLLRRMNKDEYPGARAVILLDICQVQYAQISGHQTQNVNS